MTKIDGWIIGWQSVHFKIKYFAKHSVRKASHRRRLRSGAPQSPALWNTNDSLAEDQLGNTVIIVLLLLVLSNLKIKVPECKEAWITYTYGRKS